MKLKYKPRDWERLSPLDLEAIGKALFGKYWKNQLSLIVRVRSEVVTEWMRKGSIPNSVAPILQELIDNKIEELKRVLEENFDVEEKSFKKLGILTPPPLARD